MIKFNLEKLRGKKVAVNCVTEEQAQNFVNWVNSLGEDLYDITRWKYYKEDTCYCLERNLYWDKDSKDSFENQGYEVISYEDALDNALEDNKGENNMKEVKDEFIKKVKTESIGVRINSEEEFNIWYNFLDKHMKKSLSREKRPFHKGNIYSNETDFYNIIEYNDDNGYYEERGFIIYDFKDILDKDVSKIKLSEFLKENKCYDKFINNFNKKFYYLDWKSEIKWTINNAFAWERTKEGFEYWEKINTLWQNIEHKENDMIDFFENKFEDNSKEEVKETEPLKYLVLVKGKGLPKVRHTYGNAIKEAKRLCKEAPSEVCIVEIKKTFKSEFIVKEL